MSSSFQRLRMVRSEEAGAVDPAPLSRSEDDLNAQLRQHDVRPTAHRRALLDFFIAHAHASMAQLLELSENIVPKVSYSTLYRTVDLFERQGIVEARTLQNGIAWYVLRRDNAQDHLICVACGKVVEFEIPGMTLLERRVAQRHGFELERHRYALFGRCADCGQASR